MKSQKEKAEKLGPAGTTTVNKCEEQMRKLYHVVLAYVLEKNNEDPPYTHQIQLRSRTFQSDYKEIPEWISIEKVEYQKSLIEAKDYLIKRFFSNKNLVIKVLKIEDITYLDKISASKISAETIDIGQFSNHEALWNSRNLIVRRTSDFDDFIDNLHLFKTKNFYFKDTWMELNVTMCQKLLRVLQGNVGARHLKITIRNEQNAAFLLDEIGLMPRAKYGEIPKLLCTKYPKCVILPKNLDQEINVYVTTDVVYNRCIHFKVNAKRNASLVR
uniref:FTH domain-containing protein n=1 Tax=Caenorhabditis tropicalis TaxID=1561998 RepID=A0A1I7TGG4_9PELO